MSKQLKLSANKKLAGVCGGLAEFFGIDPTLTRIIYAILTIVTGFVLGIVVYAIIWAVAPK